MSECIYYTPCRAQHHPILTPSVLEHLGRKPAVCKVFLHHVGQPILSEEATVAL